MERLQKAFLEHDSLVTSLILFVFLLIIIHTFIYSVGFLSSSYFQRLSQMLTFPFLYLNPTFDYIKVLVSISPNGAHTLEEQKSCAFSSLLYPF